jgi:uncharacterized protein (DUF1015 family)
MGEAWRWRLVAGASLGALVLALSLWLADTLGVSKSTINVCFLVLSIAGYAAIGLVCRTTRSDEYYVAGRWYRLEPREEVLPSEAVARMDAALLQKLVVGPLLGVREPLDSPLLESASGDRDISALQRKVDEGAARAVLLLHAPSVSSLLAAADAGQVLPPGSFRVDPQPLAGLALHVID